LRSEVVALTRDPAILRAMAHRPPISNFGATASLLSWLLVHAGCCTLAASGVTLVTDHPAYPSGATVTLSLSNGSRSRIAAHLCEATLERLVNGQWQTAGLPPATCPEQLYLLKPCGSSRYATILEPNLPPGEYRYRAAYAHRRTVLSNTFRISPVQNRSISPAQVNAAMPSCS